MSGNFIAYCKNNIDKKWYKYKDSIVEPCKKKDEFVMGCYILFYQALLN